MQVVKEFNKISEELLKTIPQLKPGEVRTFFMLTGVKNIDPDPKEQRKWPVRFPKHRIPTRDRIYDKFTNKYIQIGVPDIIEKDEVKHTVLLVPGMGEYQFMGRFSLVGGRGRDDEMWEYLWLTNYRNNPKNENRDKNIQPCFELLDLTEQAGNTNLQIDALEKALTISRTMKESDMKKFRASLGLPAIDDPSILRAFVRQMAKDDPDTFIKAVDHPDKDVKALITQAHEAEAIKYNSATNQVLYGKNNMVLATLTVGPQGSWVEVFGEWIKTHSDGEKVLATIQKLTKNEPEPVS